LESLCHLWLDMQQSPQQLLCFCILFLQIHK
jgi:hypothetical protein